MKYCYTDFTIPILDYFSVLSRSEFIFEWILPVIVSVLSLFLSDCIATDDFLKTFISSLTNVFAILVGFTITAIAIFTTADIEKHKFLGKLSNKEIHGVKILYFRFIYINLIFSSLSGILMIGLCLVSLFILPFVENKVVLAVLVFGALMNLLLAIRNATNLYFVFFGAAD